MFNQKSSVEFLQQACKNSDKLHVCLLKQTILYDIYTRRMEISHKPSTAAYRQGVLVLL